MDLGDVMDEIGDQLDTIDGLRVYRHTPDSISPPAAIVGFPDIDYGQTMARGLDVYSLPVTIAVGKVSERASRDRIGAYARGTGPRSIKAVVEAGEYITFDSVCVDRAEGDVRTISGVDYLAYVFTLDIAGTGAL